MWLSNTDGCAVQHWCGKTMHFLSNLTSQFQTVINQVIDPSDHGQDVVDGLLGALTKWKIMWGDAHSQNWTSWQRGKCHVDMSPHRWRWCKDKLRCKQHCQSKDFVEESKTKENAKCKNGSAVDKKYSHSLCETEPSFENLACKFTRFNKEGKKACRAITNTAFKQTQTWGLEGWLLVESHVTVQNATTSFNLIGKLVLHLTNNWGTSQMKILNHGHCSKEREWLENVRLWTKKTDNKEEEQEMFMKVVLIAGAVTGIWNATGQCWSLRKWQKRNLLFCEVDGIAPQIGRWEDSNVNDLQNTHEKQWWLCADNINDSEPVNLKMALDTNCQLLSSVCLPVR